ncbi:MAG TPA: PQQ-dependent sugar dehydrogenase [Acidobacteriaceae bacterium]|nr:PQQ-dependent sugar dehydrogenase [Acidobacteriaceae bacterium]
MFKPSSLFPLSVRGAAYTVSALAVLMAGTAVRAQQTSGVITGQAAFTDYTKEHPGVRRHLTVADLPQPMPDTSIDNGADMVPRPEGVMPQAPDGFKVQIYADGGFQQPRLIRTAPNGDVFLADSKAGEVIVLRGVGADGKAQTRETFATGLDHPFGIAFYPAGSPKWVYVANTTSVVRFAYKSGDLKATGAPETVVPVLPGYAQLRGGGHWTRDVQFSLDGKRMFVSVGSGSNVDDPDTHPREKDRADVLEFTPEGKMVKVWAYGIRNCVGEAINPITGALWCSTNERDGLGDNLVPDYISSVPEGSFFGWPWWYMGGHQDPRLVGTHPELKDKVRTPDVILQPHFASLEMTFYPVHGGQFPPGFDGDAFAAEHGSWNKHVRAGYEVIRVPMKNGKATGEYEDFLTGFVNPDGKVWGRPVGVSVMKDGSLLVTDDGSNTVWRVSYAGSGAGANGR